MWQLDLDIGLVEKRYPYIYCAGRQNLYAYFMVPLFSEIFFWFQDRRNISRTAGELPLGMYIIMMIKKQNLKMFGKIFIFSWLGGAIPKCGGGSTFGKNHLFFEEIFTFLRLAFPSGL